MRPSISQPLINLEYCKEIIRYDRKCLLVNGLCQTITQRDHQCGEMEKSPSKVKFIFKWLFELFIEPIVLQLESVRILFPFKARSAPIVLSPTSICSIVLGRLVHISYPPILFALSSFEHFCKEIQNRDGIQMSMQPE